MPDTQYIEIFLSPLPSLGPQPTFLEKLIWDIWPHRGQEINNLFKNGGSDIEPSTDHPFAVLLGDIAIGISGFYLYGETQVGLSWHGIAPAFRDQGYSKVVFKAVCDLATRKYPDADCIIELIPSDRDDLIPYFEKLGFRNSCEYATWDYLPKNVQWRIFKAPLQSEELSSRVYGNLHSLQREKDLRTNEGHT